MKRCPSSEFIKIYFFCLAVFYSCEIIADLKSWLVQHHYRKGIMLARNAFGCIALNCLILMFDWIFVGAVVQPGEPRCLRDFLMPVPARERAKGLIIVLTWCFSLGWAGAGAPRLNNCNDVSAFFPRCASMAVFWTDENNFIAWSMCR